MSQISDFSLGFLGGSQALGWTALIVLGAASIYLYNRTNPPLSTGLKTLLASLRVVALLALFVTIFEPVVSYQLSGQRKPKLSVITDVSGSMRAEASAGSRLSAVNELIGQPAFSAIRNKYDVTNYYLAESLMVSRPAENDEPYSGGTGLGEALDALGLREAADQADVWLLFSDGINNTGREPTQVASVLPVPVISVGVGAVDDGFDIEIADVEYNPVAYVGAAAPIKAKLRWRNAAAGSGDAVVQLLENGTPIAEERITLGQGDLSGEVELTFTPQTPGGKFLEIRVSGAAREKLTKNNSRSFAIKALKSKMQVLLVTESLNWDHKFIKQALSENKRIEVVEVVDVSANANSVKAFPVSGAELGQFDVVILNNPSGARSDNRYNLLGSFVADAGGGLFVFLGERFSHKQSGGFASERALDSLLPVRPPSGPAQVTLRATALTVRAENILHPALRISDGTGDVRADWKEFAPFAYVAPLTEKVAGALSLGESDYQALSEAGDKSAISLLSSVRQGNGKILCLNGGPIWRMAFQSIDTDAARSRFSAFVNGAVSWLAITEDISPVTIQPERDVFSRGEPVLFSATAFDRGYRELENVEGEVYLYSEDLKDTLVASLEKIGAGLYRAAFDGVTPGAYRFEGRALSSGAPVKTDTGSIQITPYSLEERETTPRFAVLQSISGQTGGRFLHISQADQLTEALPGAPIAVAESVEIPFRGPWQFLLVFILALSLEWALRKRYQLL